MPISRILPLALACAALAFTSAIAATPESGKVSKAGPVVKWSGETTSAAVTANAWNQDNSFPCEAPVCDTFALEVVDPGGDLTIKLNINAEATSGTGSASLRITDPAGKITVASGDSNSTTALKATVKNAVKGTYTIDTANSYVCCGTQTYSAVADLAFAGAVPAPGATTPAPPPAASETKMTVKAPAASAKKLNKARKLVATLTSTGPVSKVRVVLVKGTKQFGQGTVASVNGKAKVTVKFKKKLKPGSYGLAAGGTDANGRSVQTGVKFKIKK